MSIPPETIKLMTAAACRCGKSNMLRAALEEATGIPEHLRMAFVGWQIAGRIGSRWVPGAGALGQGLSQQLAGLGRLFPGERRRRREAGPAAG